MAHFNHPPSQTQDSNLGFEYLMNPPPESIKKNYKPSEKLKNKVAIITGGDSGIGRAIALHYALEKCRVVIVYNNEHVDAEITQKLIAENQGECLLISGDIGNHDFCKQVVDLTIKKFAQIDIVVNNAGELTPQENFEDISPQQLERTFRTNIFGMFYLVHAALPYLKEKSCIINTASSTAYKGQKDLVDYSASKGAVIAFTRSLSQNLMDRKIRVNAVAPGLIWTPLIVANYSKEEIEKFSSSAPMGRPGQPSEAAPCYVFLASEDASYMTGQVMHPNGGSVINT